MAITTETTSGTPLAVNIDHPVVQKLTLPEPLIPSSWTVNLNEPGSIAKPLSELSVIVKDSLQEGNSVCYISVEQDVTGRHFFVKLLDAIEQVQNDAMDENKSEADVKLYEEEFVKDVENVHLLYAQRDNASNNGSEAKELPVALDMSHLVTDRLAPHSAFTNYSVVPWLSLGLTQRLILSNEDSLLSNPKRDQILSYVTLIVNCHRGNPDVSKYKAGVPGVQVISHSVSKWWHAEPDSILAKNDDIQHHIWHHLNNGGSVVVHCLAGIHRAACIVACQYMYRHYVLGHKYISNDEKEIYDQMRSVRPMVSEAYTPVLRNYEKHVREGGSSLARPNDIKMPQLKELPPPPAPKMQRKTSRSWKWLKNKKKLLRGSTV